MLAPLPAGLVGCPPERHPTDLDQLEAPERELRAPRRARSKRRSTNSSIAMRRSYGLPGDDLNRGRVADRRRGHGRGKGPDRERGEPVPGRRRSPEARQKTTSPSTSEKTGSTARATPALAIRATRVQAGLSSGASVITQTSVVLRSSRPRPVGRAVHRRDQRCVRIDRAVARRGPARAPRRRAPITSPNAFTTASAATVVPAAGRAGRVADPAPGADARDRGSCPPPRRSRRRPGPRSGTCRSRGLAGRVAGVRRRAAPPGSPCRQVVDHRRGDDRHQAAGRRVARARAPRSQRTTPSAAARPKALPPVSSTAVTSSVAGERADHVGLARPGPAAAHVDPAAAPRRRDHDGAAGDARRRRSSARSRSRRAARGVAHAPPPRAARRGAAAAAGSPGRSRSSGRRPRSAGSSRRSAGTARPRACGRGTRPASTPRSPRASR